ncbi:MULTISPECIES: DUF4212 domain-containing protein [Micromonospora]|uniref:Sodium symporter small subunit domain-containing protein n=1 Tax=Micromonospora gifhornensis TaxID=84594 RepID=A0ABQ4ILZ9_9ACTN|nr:MULTISPECIES: DUF4212 domain-containing protein [Micromonospora]PMR62351.1 DUF4212 domain-containing protein [Verrucosispora sp. ts21]GIJ18932.1 hypothetical protein Vgi01_56160 [Micromonospora gifhornensis]
MTEVTPEQEARGGEPPPPGSAPPDNGWRKEYWNRNLRLMVILLAIWFIVSFGFGVLLVEPLNEIVIAGFPLGFWFAQQGSIYVFVILILVYAKMMDRLDSQFGVAEPETEEAAK